MSNQEVMIEDLSDQNKVNLESLGVETISTYYSKFSEQSVKSCRSDVQMEL